MLFYGMLMGSCLDGEAQRPLRLCCYTIHDVCTQDLRDMVAKLDFVYILFTLFIIVVRDAFYLLSPWFWVEIHLFNISR